MVSNFIKGPGWLVDGIKVVLTVVVSTVTATVTATWTIRGMLDEHDKRITVNETKIVRIETDLVPRREHEIAWKSADANAAAIREGLRDVQADIKTLLRDGSKK